jgi:hypothetical protein
MICGTINTSDGIAVSDYYHLLERLLPYGLGVLGRGHRKHYAVHEPGAYSKLTHLTASDERWLNAKIIIYLSIETYLRRPDPRNKTQFNLQATNVIYIYIYVCVCVCG